MRSIGRTMKARYRSTLDCGRWARIALVAALGLALGACASDQGRRRRVAVLDFENTLSESRYQGFAKAMATMLHDQLANEPDVSTVERHEVEKAQERRSLRDLVSANPGSLRSIGKKLKADYLVVGSISRLQENFIINARLFSVATGEIVPGTSRTRSCRRESDLYPLIQSLAHFMGYQVRNYENRARLAEEMRQRGTTPAVPVENP